MVIWSWFVKTKEKIRRSKSKGRENFPNNNLFSNWAGNWKFFCTCFLTLLLLLKNPIARTSFPLFHFYAVKTALRSPQKSVNIRCQGASVELCQTSSFRFFWSKKKRRWPFFSLLFFLSTVRCSYYWVLISEGN